MSKGYSEENRSHTENAHLLARELIYPRYFNCPADKIEYRDDVEYVRRDGQKSVIDKEKLDGIFAIDRVIRPPAPVDLGYVEVTVQERFERAHAAAYRNISITHFTAAARNPGELYKIKATYFVSGYFDERENVMVGKAHVCSVQRILEGVQNGSLKFYTKENTKKLNQEFLTFGYEDLERVGAVMMAIDFRHDPVQVYEPGNAVFRELAEVNASIRELSRQNVSMMGMLKQMLDRPLGKTGKVLSLVPKTGDLFGSAE